MRRGKLAGLAGAVTFVATFVWFLRRHGVGLVALALLALAASSADLLFRVNMTRVQAFVVGVPRCGGFLLRVA